MDNNVTMLQGCNSKTIIFPLYFVRKYFIVLIARFDSIKLVLINPEAPLFAHPLPHFLSFFSTTKDLVTIVVLSYCKSELDLNISLGLSFIWWHSCNELLYGKTNCKTAIGGI